MALHIYCIKFLKSLKYTPKCADIVERESKKRKWLAITTMTSSIYNEISTL
ncbi:hypothetical protein PRECH8_24910 [Insulibacter thermoxylanivorax]|uniref:Uncharacterized protein n=1 Tax=Insulibacter thermoxylanivorax TaxID=2749268 RepID=A0A916QEU9_9BACL|nr:hypothetical protein PRECH8_24910 [Insulibacter thermoxylanivorax]